DLGIASNNTLTGNRTSMNGFSGISVVNSANNNVLTGNTSTGNVFFGIVITNSTGNTLKENQAHENGSHGITSNSSDLVLKANRANGNGFLNGPAFADELGAGIAVPTGTGGAKNKAKGNDDARECFADDVSCYVAP
ncbi:MAG: right-handed parallel beta-helix repeat-containing protein, partial [Actinomycetota bacterium]